MLLSLFSGIFHSQTAPESFRRDVLEFVSSYRATFASVKCFTNFLVIRVIFLEIRVILLAIRVIFLAIRVIFSLNFPVGQLIPNVCLKVLLKTN